MPTSSNQAYQLLVANFSRPTQSSPHGADPDNLAPTKTRTGFLFQHVQNLGYSARSTNGAAGPARSLVTNTTNAILDPFGGTPPPAGSVTVSSDVFSGTSASVLIGPFELVSNRDFVTGGGVNATATNLAVAIDSLPGYSASAVGADVAVEGPAGQSAIPFRAVYRGGAANFTFSYVADDGILSQGIGGGPVEPTEFLPAGTPNGVAP